MLLPLLVLYAEQVLLCAVHGQNELAIFFPIALSSHIILMCLSTICPLHKTRNLYIKIARTSLLHHRSTIENKKIAENRQRKETLPTKIQMIEWINARVKRLENSFSTTVRKKLTVPEHAQRTVVGIKILIVSLG